MGTLACGAGGETEVWKEQAGKSQRDRKPRKQQCGVAEVKG